ncbi:MAG: hypothetical protein KAI43_13610 [Candidatus Aureabacteria bacterium]|nr:hypothetical protein [Candidatus Auribacterota bacterium]
MTSKKKYAFILKMGELSTLFGFSHVLGQIYGLLYLTPNELSLDDIKDSLGVSKATVSLTVRELLKWGAVKRIWKAGTRRDYYEAEADFMKIFNTRLVDALLRRVNIFEEAAVSEIKEKKVAKDSDEKFVAERMENIKKMARSLGKLLHNIKNLEKHSFLKQILKKTLT